MNYDELMSIKIIPKEIAKSQSKAFVNGLHHTPYRDEIRLFSCIKQGNLKKLIFELTGKNSNIILTQDDVIIDSLKHVSAAQSSYRTILPGKA